MIAVGLFLATKFSTARYLLVEIDDDADGPNYPPGRRCEPFLEKRKCSDVTGGVVILEPAGREDCQEKCENYNTETWGCCEYQEDNAKCVFYDGSLEGEFNPGQLHRWAAQCGGRDYHYLPNTRCQGNFLTSAKNADLAMAKCKTNPNCKCIEDPNCDHENFFLYPGDPVRSDTPCAWNKKRKGGEPCDDDMDCRSGHCYDGFCGPEDYPNY